MHSYEEALAMVLERTAMAKTERIPLQSALSRTLAEAVIAPLDLPSFDNSSVDGYAVRLPIEGPLKLASEIAAGDMVGRSFEMGETLRIFTGAPVPPDADAVVMQEDTTANGDWITIGEIPAAGRNVRFKGEEVKAGEVLLPAGTVVTPPVLAVLASSGASQVEVFRKPKVSIVETGTELVDVGEPLRFGAVYASNGLALKAAAENLGAECRLFRSNDDLSTLRKTLEEALKDVDLVITSGGVSVGKHDLVRSTWNELGVEEMFWRVAIRPGKPVYFGVAPDGPVVFGLPGNPVSTLVTFYLFVRPTVLHMQGRVAGETKKLTLGQDVAGATSVDVFARTQVKDGVAFPVEAQGSHMSTGLAFAHALIRIPSGTESLPAGAEVDAIPIIWN
ncbi:MAG TPA: gephyrin-like molybdotransferase Glp [Fimbriimonas sp.]|nr:gephyrin-like molybdotransferase Glp [Fimbriimonas sp.]